AGPVERPAMYLQRRLEPVTERPAASVRDRERSGRICGYELDLHALAGERLRTAELRPGSRDFVDLSGQPFLVEAHVHEAAQVFDRGDRGSDAHPLADRLGDIARGHPRLSRQPQRDVRGVIAVLRIAGTHHLDRYAIDLGPPELGRSTGKAIFDRGSDVVAEERGHGPESGT